MDDDVEIKVNNKLKSLLKWSDRDFQDVMFNFHKNIIKRCFDPNIRLKANDFLFLF